MKADYYACSLTSSLPAIELGDYTELASKLVKRGGSDMYYPVLSYICGFLKRLSGVLLTEVCQLYFLTINILNLFHMNFQHKL